MFLIEPEVTHQAVEDALEVGYHHIDTTTGYGDEAEVGVDVHVSSIPREEVFVTTELRDSAIDQVELHPTFHAQHGIETEAWAPLGQGRYDVFSLPPIVAAAEAQG